MTTYAEKTPNTQINLTDTQKSILIWLYNNQNWIHIDQGNLMEAYVEITENQEFNIKSFLMDIQALIHSRLARIHTLNTFYQITNEGIQYLDSQIEKPITFQCPGCGDYWRADDSGDPMIDSAYQKEYPDGATLKSYCESCENPQTWTDDHL